MKKTISTYIIFLLIIFQSTALACTGFTYSEEKRVLVGSNEDWNDYDFWIRFFPAENDKYGRLIFENHWPITPDPDWHCPQNGINDQGLFYDCFATVQLIPINSSHKPYYYDSNDYYRYSLESYALSVCSTVDEVLDIYDDYNLEHMERYQVLWVDTTGASVIIEGDDIIYKQGNYQVVTNFIQTHPELGGYPCWRYNTAVNILEEMTEPSVEYFTSICDATHQTGQYPSVYSNVYDLNEKILYLYYFYNYDNVVEINLEEELLLGEHVYFLADLFDSSNNQPPDTPSIAGPPSGKAGEKYVYTFSTTDPDGDDVTYVIDWGDDSGDINIGPFPSGEEQIISHTWSEKDTYTIRAMAKDIYGAESEWTELEVSMPKTKTINLPFLTFLENHPNLFTLLQQILGL